MTQSAPRTSHDAHVLIVGGGGTGGALAHDLALRGLRVTLVERGEFTSGTTGRHHGLLHSGARYAVNDHESAVECIEENRILRAIAPGSFEENDGLFVAITDEDMAYLPGFLEGCAASGIPAEQLTPDEALRLEPMLNPHLKAAVRVPDATMDAMRMPMRFFATAKHNGARLLNLVEATGFLMDGGVVTGVACATMWPLRDAEIHADITVNATGPWSEADRAHGGGRRPDPPLARRDARRARPPVQHGDQPPARIRRRRHRRAATRVVDRRHQLLGRGGPRGSGRSGGPRGADGRRGRQADPRGRAGDSAGRVVGRATVDRIARSDGLRPGALANLRDDRPREDGRRGGFVTITGGKATTLRGMAEVCADVVCRKLGVDEPCRTRDTILLPHTAYFAA